MIGTRIIILLSIFYPPHSASFITSPSLSISSSRQQKPSFLAQPPISHQRHSAKNERTKPITTSTSLHSSHFQPYFSFPLDQWQTLSGSSILSRQNLIVTAPTGAGKTVVAEMALHSAFHSPAAAAIVNGRGDVGDGTCVAIYTTPLKALSNQKFSDLREVFGKTNVGLLTGDICINREAKILVMTTEVYRNLCWSSTTSSTSLLSSLQTVILDEFHYMGQPLRGGVWEECVITTPPHVPIVALSATLPNAHHLRGWMESVTSRPTTHVDAGGGRPVPLKYLWATGGGVFGPLFRESEAGPGGRLGLLGLRGDSGTVGSGGVTRDQ